MTFVSMGKYGGILVISAVALLWFVGKESVVGLLTGSVTMHMFLTHPILTK